MTSREESYQRKNLCSILLLEGEKTASELTKFVYDKHYRGKEGQFKEEYQSILDRENIFIRREGKIVPKRNRKGNIIIIEGEEQTKIDKRCKPYDIDFDLLLDEWKTNLINESYLPSDHFREKYYSIKTEVKDEEGQNILYDEMRAIEDGRFTRDHLFREFVTKNREFLFNIEDFKILFYKDNKWCLPSVFGFMNMALFYFYYCASGNKDRSLIKNTLPLLIKVHSRLLNEEHNKIQKRHEEFLKKHTDRFNEMYGNKEDEAEKGKALVIDLFFHASQILVKVGGWLNYVLILSEGIPVRLDYKILTKILERRSERKRQEKTKRRSSSKFIKDTDDMLLSYNMPLPELLQYMEPIQRMMKLFE